MALTEDVCRKAINPDPFFLSTRQPRHAIDSNVGADCFQHRLGHVVLPRKISGAIQPGSTLAAHGPYVAGVGEASAVAFAKGRPAASSILAAASRFRTGIEQPDQAE